MDLLAPLKTNLNSEDPGLDGNYFRIWFGGRSAIVSTETKSAIGILRPHCLVMPYKSSLWINRRLALSLLISGWRKAHSAILVLALLSCTGSSFRIWWCSKEDNQELHIWHLRRPTGIVTLFACSCPLCQLCVLLLTRNETIVKLLGWCMHDAAAREWMQHQLLLCCHLRLSFLLLYCCTWNQITSIQNTDIQTSLAFMPLDFEITVICFCPSCQKKIRLCSCIHEKHLNLP